MTDRIEVMVVHGHKPYSDGFGTYKYTDCKVYLDGEVVYSTQDKYKAYMFAAELRLKADRPSAVRPAEGDE